MECRGDGGHPALGDIEQYCANGEAPPELIERVEKHLADCRECSLLMVRTVRRLMEERGEI
jgi:hypothetical protein